MEKQESARGPGDMSDLEAAEQALNICSQIIDSLVDMVYLAAADEEFLTPEVMEWLDALQKHAQKVMDIMADADAED